MVRFLILGERSHELHLFGILFSSNCARLGFKTSQQQPKFHASIFLLTEFRELSDEVEPGYLRNTCLYIVYRIRRSPREGLLISEATELQPSARQFTP